MRQTLALILGGEGRKWPELHLLQSFPRLLKHWGHVTSDWFISSSSSAGSPPPTRPKNFLTNPRLLTHNQWNRQTASLNYFRFLHYETSVSHPDRSVKVQRPAASYQSLNFARVFTDWWKWNEITNRIDRALNELLFLSTPCLRRLTHRRRRFYGANDRLPRINIHKRCRTSRRTTLSDGGFISAVLRHAVWEGLRKASRFLKGRKQNAGKHQDCPPAAQLPIQTQASWKRSEKMQFAHQMTSFRKHSSSIKLLFN